MYNLLIVSQDGYWDGSPATFDQSRIFEYTSKALAEQFSTLEGEQLQTLLSLPFVFGYESAAKADANIGFVSSFRKRGKEVRLEFQFDPAFPAITQSSLEKLVWELDIGEWELNRTHWAVKDVDLFAELLKANLITEKQLNSSHFNTVKHDEAAPLPLEFRPTVFRFPNSGIENDLISVMRPFNENFGTVQSTLERACSELKLRCLDVNKVWGETEIIQDIFSLIYRSSVVICDFTDRNPNVFYEAGIAHTLGRQVIPIVQNNEDVPFDLKHHRYIMYEKSDDGLKDLHLRVSARLRTLLKI
jgi:hypothetical protein